MLSDSCLHGLPDTKVAKFKKVQLQDIQHQLLTDMKDICSIFKTFEHQCSSYVQVRQSYLPIADVTNSL